MNNRILFTIVLFITIASVVFINTDSEGSTPEYSNWESQGDGTYHASIDIDEGHRCISVYDDGDYENIVLVVGSEELKPNSIQSNSWYWEVDYSSARTAYFKIDNLPRWDVIGYYDEEFKGIVAASDLGIPYDTFSVVPGKMILNKAVSGLYLVVNNATIYGNTRDEVTVYDVPSASDTAYFFSNSNLLSPASVYHDIEYAIEPVEYESKIISSRDYKSVFHLDVGNYQMTFASAGRLVFSDKTINQVRFEAGISQSINVNVSTDAWFEPNYYGTYVSCTISPNVFEKVDESVAWEKVSGAAYYKWFSVEIWMEKGTHDISISNTGYAVEAFVKDSQEQIDFKNNIAVPGKYTSWDPYKTIELEQDSMVVIYALCEYYSKSIYWASLTIDKEYTLPEWSLVNDSQWVSIYLGANSSSDLSVKYDDTQYYAVLRNGDGGIGLVSEVLYQISTDWAREYWILLVPTSPEASMTEAEFSLYTSNAEKSDDMGMVFALVCIILCALLFGLLGYSARKPSWQK